MKYIAPSLGIISAFAFCIFIMNQQLKDIQVLKQDLRFVIEKHNDINHKYNECIRKAEYEKQWRCKITTGKEPNSRNLPPLMREV